MLRAYNYCLLETERYFASLNPITGEVDLDLLKHYPKSKVKKKTIKEDKKGK